MSDRRQSRQAESCLSQPNKLLLNRPPYGWFALGLASLGKLPAEVFICPSMGLPMKERRQMRTIEVLIAKAKVRPADYIIPGIWLDSLVRMEEGIRLPLTELKANNYKLYGCYAWFQPENSKGEADVMYVGRSTRIRNRLQQYWNDTSNPRFLEAWSDWAEENDEPFTPYVAIWLCENPTDLEIKLIKALNPKYNVYDRTVRGNRDYFNHLDRQNGLRRVPLNRTDLEQLPLFTTPAYGGAR